MSLRILLVDDSAITGESLGVLLRVMGHETDWAADSREALSRLAACPYDAAVVDYFMPGGTGLDLLRRIRAAGLGNLPVVVATAAGKEDAESIGVVLQTLQPAGLIRKPFGVADLLALIESLKGGVP